MRPPSSERARTASGRAFDNEREQPINVAEFSETFLTAHIRAQLTLDGEAGFAVEEYYGSSRGVLGDLFTVWYTTPGGRQAQWRDPGAVPLRVRDAARGTIVWECDRRRKLEDFGTLFRAQTEPVQLILPVLCAASGRNLLLDGTHRAVAAYGSGAPVTLFVFTLRGPAGPETLPDLAHHL